MNYCGIDISQNTFDCCFLVDGTTYYNQFNQDESGYFSFLHAYNLLKVDVVGFESTGVYHKNFEKYLISNGVNPLVLSPLSVSHFIKSLKIRGKSDKSDSYGIAVYLSKNENLVPLSYPTRDFFKPFTASLAQLEKQKRQLINLSKSIAVHLPDSMILNELSTSIKSVDSAYSNIEKHALEMLYDLCPESLLIKNEIRGVGDGLILRIIPLIYDHFDKFTMSQIVSFVGISPAPYESGTSVKRNSHITKKGDFAVRRALYMASVSSVRYNPILREKYLRLKANGKSSKVALVAVMAQLLRAIVSRLSYHTGRKVKK